MSPSASTEVTLPTFTPAMRTGDVVRSVVAFSNVALSSVPPPMNGRSFV